MDYFTVKPRKGCHFEPPDTLYYNTYAAASMRGDVQRPVVFSGEGLTDTPAFRRNLIDPSQDYISRVVFFEDVGPDSYFENVHEPVQISYYNGTSTKKGFPAARVIDLASSEISLSADGVASVPELFIHHKPLLEFALACEYGLTGDMIGFKTMRIIERIFPSMRRVKRVMGREYEDIHIDQRDVPQRIEAGKEVMLMNKYLFWDQYAPGYLHKPLMAENAIYADSLRKGQSYMPAGNGVLHNGLMEHFSKMPKLFFDPRRKPRVLVTVEFEGVDQRDWPSALHQRLRENTIEQTRRLAKNPERRLRDIGLQPAASLVVA